MKKKMIVLLAMIIVAAFVIPGSVLACDCYCGEGCTPGYWKQAHHFDSWTGFEPDDSYEAVFGVSATCQDGLTLLEALKKGGGGECALGRHAVAALLNASNP
ncbi:MAG: hypothetical protein JRE16_05570, partial [Deltaproteobacteria bacterium]|nr:hypothetical protein [Deltaproteobacteria bacterium]